MTTKQKLTWSYVACGVLAIGSLGPWATIGPFSKGGTEGDGVLTLIGAGLVALALWRWSTTNSRKILIAALVVAVLSALVAVYDAVDVPGDGVSLGWGLILALIASIALTVLCFIQLRQASESTA